MHLRNVCLIPLPTEAGTLIGLAKVAKALARATAAARGQAPAHQGRMVVTMSRSTMASGEEGRHPLGVSFRLGLGGSSDKSLQPHFRIERRLMGYPL